MATRSQTELNPFAICKPIGFFSKALYSDKKVVFWSITVIQLINGLIFMIEVCSFKKTLIKVNFSICAAYALSCGISIIVVWWNRNRFIDIFNHFERNVTIHSLCPSLVPHLKKHRLIIKLNACVCFSLFFITAIYTFAPISKSNSSVDAWKYIIISIIKTIGMCAYYVFLGFSIETCLYIQSCFLQVEYKIQALVASNSEPNIADIRQIRFSYCIAIENTEMINSFLFFLFGLYFVLGFVATHFSFAAFIALPAFTTAIMTIGNIITFSLVIYHMIYINHIAGRIYEQVYTFTFKTYSLEVSKEIQLLLTRIARADVGLTFLDIFVITPTCVTSLATISLTIALATPAFTKYIRL